MMHIPVILRVAAAGMLLGTTTCGQPQNAGTTPVDAVATAALSPDTPLSVVTAANRTDTYLPLLKGKKIGMVINQTSVMGSNNKTLTVDSLLKRGVGVKKIFGPEHGFRGNAADGADITNSTDVNTGLPVISLYGKHFKPTTADLQGIDLMIFDIQDVGTRFYTYISTLHYVMEACAENNIPLLVFDRPNPNGYLIDGPILETAFKSFVGMHHIPVSHGMTIGEYAQMINGEKWLNKGLQCSLRVIKMDNYNHHLNYTLPVNPSPNLNTQQSVLLYPSLCFFEGTSFSLGRGTLFPFQVIGHPALKGSYSFAFTPVSIPGMSDNPPQKGKTCYGINLQDFNTETLKQSGMLNLHWLIELYNAFPDKETFFNAYFTKLAGTTQLQKQIETGKTEDEIRQSWQPGLNTFKSVRKKYLLYP